MFCSCYFSYCYLVRVCGGYVLLMLLELLLYDVKGESD